jgi:predicted DNA-binding protein
MRRRKMQTTIYLDQKQVRELRNRAKRTGVPQAVLIRQAIDNWLWPAPALVRT